MKFSIGNSDLKKLREEGRDFIDKTLFVKEVLEDSADAFLITRPRRFGKTFNMSILRYFFDIRDAEENRKLFKGTLIEKAKLDDEQSCMDFQGQYPVIFITLKDVRETSYKGMCAAIAGMVSKLYEEHQYLLDSDILTSHKKEIYNQIIEERSSFQHLCSSLKDLTEYLYRFYNKRVVILMDEYDIPMHSAFEAKEPYHEELLPFMRSFMSSAFKDNIYLYKGILTGVLRVSLMNLFSGMNNVFVYTMLTHNYASYFGFTEAEVNNLFKAERNQDIAEMKRWYNGYRVGVVTLYNPWSIVCCYIQKGKLEPYWLQTGEHGILGKALITSDRINVLEQLQQLIEDKPIETKIDERTIFVDIERNPNALWSLMLFAGYLKAVGFRVEGDGAEAEVFYKLMIPNLEVKSAFVKMIENWSLDILQQKSFIIFSYWE